MKKKLISIILAIAMLACTIPLGTLTAFAEEFPGELSSLCNTMWAGKAARITPNNDRLPFDYDYTLHINEGGDMATLKVPGFNDWLSLDFSEYNESEGTITFSEDYTLKLKYESDEYGNVKPKWFTLTSEEQEGLSNDFDDYKMLPALPEELQNIVWEIYDYDGDKCMIDFGVSDVVVYYKNVITCATLTSLDKDGDNYEFGTPGESDSVVFNGMYNTVYGFGFTDAYGNNYYSGEHFDQYDCTWHEWYDNFFVTVGKPEDNAKVKLCMDGWYDFEYGQPTEFPGVRLTSVIDGLGATYRICGEIFTKLSVTYETIDDYYCFADGKQYSFDLEEDNARAECPNVFRKVSVPTANPDLYYTGETQTGVDDGEGYTVTNGKAKEVGTYTATATINNGCVWYNESTGEIEWNTKQHTIDWEILPAPHTHTPGTEYMTDGRAHWLKCDDENCPLNKADDPVLAYEIAFSSYEGDALKEALDYSETCHTNGADTTSMLMGRQGKLDKSTGVVSNTDGRTIIGLTQSDLDKIGNKLVIVGSDDSDNNKQVSVDVDCAYTWFYDIVDGEPVQIKAEDCDCAAFVIIDSSLAGTITGFGYYRVYNDTISDSTLIGEALYKAPRTFKAVYDENGDQSLNFYFDCKDHSDEGTVFENGTDNYLFDGTKEDNTNWGYNDIRDSIKGVVIDKSVIKYKGLTDTSYMFYSMNYADSIVGAEYLDVSNVTVMGLMFSEFGDCSDSLTQAPDISNWNTGNVTAMDFMFQNYGGCVESLNFILNLSGWNLSKVSGCDNVFANCCQSGTWKVTIPAKTGNTDNTTDKWYVGDGTNPDSYIEPADDKSFTLAN